MKESSRAAATTRRVKSDDGENQFGNCRSNRASARDRRVRVKLFNLFGAGGGWRRAHYIQKNECGV
jgi:hypothetical protein